MNDSIINKYFKVFLYLVPLLLNIILILRINSLLLGNSFININDGAIFFTKIDAYKKFFTFWGENNLGFVNSLPTGLNFFSHLFSLILLKFNLQIKWMEIIIYFTTFTCIFYSSWYAFYLIQKRVFEKSNNIFFPFLAAFFYSYNFFNISFIGIIDIFFLQQVLYPYLLWILIILLDKEISLKYILILGLIISFTINASIFSFAVYICLFLPFIFLKKNIFSIKNVLSFTLIFVIAFLLAGPLIYALIYAYTTPSPYSGTQINLISLIFPPYGIMGVFQFFFHWTITYLNTFSNLYFKTSYGLFSSYMIWVLLLIMLVTSWKEIKNKRILLFLMFSLILAMFLCKGGQKPFGEFNMLMYDFNPLFAIFRTPGSKFGISIMLILPALILYVLNVNKKRVFLIIIAVTIFMQTWVFFNPINFVGEETAWWNKPVVKISQDYKNLISFLNNKNKSGTVLFHPALSGGHYDLKNGVKFSFQDVLGKYIKRPIIYADKNLQLNFFIKIMNKIVESFDPKLVGNSSIQYIIIRQDYDIHRQNEKAEVNKALKIIEAKDFKKVFTSKLFTVFEVKDKYFKDIITIRTPKQEYTPPFKKIAPYHYIVNVKIQDMLDNQIIFRNNYHPDWKILNIEKQELKAKQILVDNFANGWKIEALNHTNTLNLNQDIELNIYFYPQKNLFFLSILSLISLSTILITFIFLILKERKKTT